MNIKIDKNTIEDAKRKWENISKDISLGDKEKEEANKMLEIMNETLLDSKLGVHRSSNEDYETITDIDRLGRKITKEEAQILKESILTDLL